MLPLLLGGGNPGAPAPVAESNIENLFGGLLQALIDAFAGSDQKIGGQAFTRLMTTLEADDVAGMSVESTLGFGDYTEGTGDALLLVGGEVIQAGGRSEVTGAFGFDGLARGLQGSTAKTHPIGTLVFDLARNSSGMDQIRRGMLVNFALGEDLDVVGSNLGLARCVGLSDEEWREAIKAIAYLPKNTMDAIRRSLTSVLGPSGFLAEEQLGSATPGGDPVNPYQLFIEVAVALASSLRGRFVLNGGEPQLTTGALTVVTDYDINHVIGVFDDNAFTRMGYRNGFTNYFTAGSFVGDTITLGASPGAAGTPVLVDYGAWEAHYLAPSEAILDDSDLYAYLTSPLQAARCLLDQIKAAGVLLDLSLL